MRSHVNWAVLGMLVERPSYGYEVYQRLGRRFPPELLQTTKQHVYSALNVLEREGWIEVLLEDEPEAFPPARGLRQPKIPYRVTAEGSRALRAWLAAELRTDPAQADFVRRVALAAGMGRPGLMQAMVDAYEDGCAREAHVLPLLRVDGVPARSPEVLVRRLTVAARRAAIEAQMAWVRYARKEIEAFEHRRDPQPGPEEPST